MSVSPFSLSVFAFWLLCLCSQMNINLALCCIFLLAGPFIVIKYPSLSVLIPLVLKSVSSGIDKAVSTLFRLVFSRFIFFHPFTFNLSEFLDLKCFTCKQYIVAFGLLSQSYNPYLLIEIFSSFTFNAISDIFGFEHIILLFFFLRKGKFHLPFY